MELVVSLGFLVLFDHILVLFLLESPTNLQQDINGC